MFSICVAHSRIPTSISTSLEQKACVFHSKSILFRGSFCKAELFPRDKGRHNARTININTCNAFEDTSSSIQSPDVDQKLPGSPPDNRDPGWNLSGWSQLAFWMFFFGAGLGPPLDGIHSIVGLQEYDNGAITIGGEPYGLHTNIWVFPLLGVFYSILGVIQIIFDRIFDKSSQLKPGSWLSVLSSVGVLIGLLRLSAQMYEGEVPYPGIFSVLAVCGHVNWYAFDRTWWGYLLAVAVGVAAPASEVIVMRYFELWHYEAPDIFIGEEGLVSWTSCCYFFYTQWVATLARCLETFLLPKPKKPEIESSEEKKNDL